MIVVVGQRASDRTRTPTPWIARIVYFLHFIEGNSNVGGLHVEW